MHKMCDQCLFTNNRIVPSERAQEVIQDALDGDSYFICHKHQDEGVCCRGFFDKHGRDSLVTRMAQVLDLVEEVDVD